MSSASAGPIYVWRESDGTVHFTNKEPPAGVAAQVFTAKKSGFSWYKGSYRIRPFKYMSVYRQRFAPIIEQAARAHRIESSLVKAVIHVESAFNPDARSNKGAVGLMQILPSRGRLLGVRDLYAPEQNIFAGTRHLAFLLRKYGGNLRYALAAYNAGEGAVSKYGGIPPYAETQEYVRRVLAMRAQYYQAEYRSPANRSMSRG